MPSLFVVAGDPSGDAHAARLVHALRARVPGLTLAGLGGPALRTVGVTLLQNLTAAAAIGPFDAARHLGRLLEAKRRFAEHLRSRRPDLVLLVDFGDFNLPVLAPLAKRHGVRVIYYISPQLWAWGRFRLRYVRRYVDRMLVLFPFEEAFYRAAGVPVTWVGHPLVEHATPTLSRDEAFTRFTLNPWRMTLGVLPGSRTDEVRRLLPLMLKAAARVGWEMPGVQALVAKAPGVPPGLVERMIGACPTDVRVAEGSIYDALQCVDAALVASGTATLETALAGVPMAVVYRTSWPTYAVARTLVRIPQIALVNVVAGRRVVPELLQHRATPRALAREAVDLLRNAERAETMRKDLRGVASLLGSPGAIERAAAALHAELAPA